MYSRILAVSRWFNGHLQNLFWSVGQNRFRGSLRVPSGANGANKKYTHVIRHHFQHHRTFSRSTYLAYRKSIGAVPHPIRPHTHCLHPAKHSKSRSEYSYMFRSQPYLTFKFASGALCLGLGLGLGFRVRVRVRVRVRLPACAPRSA